MSIDESTPAQTAGVHPESHGFTLSKRRKWPYIVVAILAIAAFTAYFILQRGGGTKSANETAGANLQVVYLDSNPAEKRIIDYIGDNIAAEYDVKVAAVGLGDSTQINSAPRALRDLDAIVRYAESFLAAGVSEDRLIFAPKSPDEFASVPTVGSDYIDTPNIQNLIKAFNDPRVQTFIATDPEVRKLALPGRQP